MNTRAIGNIGECAVCRYLEEQGYTIRDRNFCVRGGEIDIVAEKGEYLCFVEVKTRSVGSWETGDEAVTRIKMDRIIRTAYHYLEKREIDANDWYIRYDIASVELWQGVVVSIDYLEAAFDESDFSW